MVVRIGVIALQGNVEEHIQAAERVLAERDGGEVVPIKHGGINLGVIPQM